MIKENRCFLFSLFQCVYESIGWVDRIRCLVSSLSLSSLPSLKCDPVEMTILNYNSYETLKSIDILIVSQSCHRMRTKTTQ